jgi:hypothetical protein
MKTSNKIVIIVVALVVLWVSLKVWMILDGVQDLAQERESIYMERVTSRIINSDTHHVTITSDGNIVANLSKNKLKVLVCGSKDYAEVAEQNIDSILHVNISKADTNDLRHFYLEYQIMSLESIRLMPFVRDCSIKQILKLNVDQQSSNKLLINATHITHLTIENSHFTELRIVSDSSNCPITIYITDSSIIEDLYVDITRPGKLVLETYGKNSNTINTSNNMKQIMPIPEESF